MKAPSHHPDPDPKLIRGARKGDRNALRELLEAVSPSVRQWALAHTGDLDRAADLSQDVFLLLLRHIGSFRGESSFYSWLFSITRNQALEGFRRRERREKKVERFKTIGNPEQPIQAEPGGKVDRERVARALEAFLTELPPRQREVFQLSELQGLSSPEIGRILGVKPVSVRAALMKARRTLRRRILSEHPEFVEEYLT